MCWVRNLGQYIIKVVFQYFSVVLPTSTEESHYIQNQFIYNKLYSLLYSRNVKLEDTYSDHDIEKAFMDYSRSIFEEKTKPSLLLSKQVGNMYTPSLYGCLVSLLIR
jgi:3-hydroxy-3-methylglutaryl CoA synthase